MKLERIVVCIALTVALLHTGVAVQPVIGFGRLADTAFEGDNAEITIRIQPDPPTVDVSGLLVPLTYAEYEVYNVQRVLSVTVMEALEIARTRDPAESNDFNNATVNFTIASGTLDVAINVGDIIRNDTVNEAEEIFIIVLEVTENGGVDIAFDEEAGILVYEIQDNNPINLILRNNGSTSFPESFETIANVLTVEKESGSPETEVDIPINVTITGSGTVIEGEDFSSASYSRSYVIGINETVVFIDPIQILDDSVPETNEMFSISLEKGVEAEFLNIFPTTTPIEITIEDDDEAQVVFTEEIYTVTEGEDVYVEVCIALYGDVSLSSSSANGTFDISTTNVTATMEDYNPTPDPVTLVLKRGQGTVCSNITIIDDLHVEEDKRLNVTVTEGPHTFAAGVNILRGSAVVIIEDDDAAVVGFNQTQYTGMEGETLTVCTDILFPNATVLALSSVQGTFNIIGSDEPDIDIISGDTLFVLNSTASRYCVDISLVSDGDIEGNENLFLSLEEIVTRDSFGVRLLRPNTTNITIIDRDFGLIGFSKTSYIVKEGESETVCVGLNNENNIAPDVSITYTLKIIMSDVTQGVTFSTLSGEFSQGTTLSCHNVTVVDNNFAERDGTISLRIQNATLSNVNVSTTDVAVEDNDEILLSMTIPVNQIDEGAGVNITVSYDNSAVSIGQGISVQGSVSKSGPTDDYVLDPEAFSFESDTNIAMIRVEAVDDILFEDLIEKFTISLSLNNPPVNVRILKSQLVIEIKDNEEVIIAFQRGRQNFSEDAGIGHPLLIEIVNSDKVRIPPPIGNSVSVSAVLVTESTNATEGTDFTVELNTVAFRNSTTQPPQSAVLNILQDTLVEGHEVINITLTDLMIFSINHTGGAKFGENKTVLVTILDNDQYIVGFNRTAYMGTEGDPVEVCIDTMAGTLQSGVTLAYLVGAPREDATQPAGSMADTAMVYNSTSGEGDFTMTTLRINLNSQNTDGCVMVQLIEDEIVEINETFYVQLEQVVSSDDLRFPLSPEYAVITIIDDDEIKLGFTAEEYIFNENTTFNITVQRENPVTVSSTFSVIVRRLPESNATEDDFSVMGGFNVTLAFGGNDERQSFQLTLVPDNIGEGPETIELQIVVPAGELGGVVPGNINRTTVVIVDDDYIEYQFTQPDYNIIEDTTVPVCVMIVPGDVIFTSGGFLTLRFLTSPITANYNVDYNDTTYPMMITLTDNIRMGCVNVTVFADELVEGMESFQLYFETVDQLGSYSVIDNSSREITIFDTNVADVGFNFSVYPIEESDTVVSFCVVVFDGQLTDAVSLTYNLSSQPDSATADTDYLPAVIPDHGELNYTHLQACHMMNILDDELVEPPENIVISITPTGPTQEFIDLFDIVQEETVVQIIDDDTVTIGFEQSLYTVREDAGSVDVCLRFRGPLKNDSFVELQITINSSIYTDHAAVPVPDTLRLDMNDTLECVTINITDDIIVEGREMFAVHFDETDGNTIMIAGDNTVPVYIEDDEEVILEFVQQNYTFAESSNTSDAVIGVTIVNYNEVVIMNDISFRVTSASGNATYLEDFVFVHGNGEISIPIGQDSTTFMLNMTDDMLVEGIEDSVLVISSPDIESIAPDNVVHMNETTVFIVDNDDATIGFASTTYTYAEGVRPVCVTLMNGTLQDNVVIRYSVFNISTDGNYDDYDPVNEVGEITSQRQTFCHNITIIDDNLVESLEQVDIMIVEEFNVASVFLSPDISTITIDDDDSVLVGFKYTMYSSIETGGALVEVTIEREDDLVSVHDFSVRLVLSPDSNASSTENDFRILGGNSQLIDFEKTQSSENVSVTVVHDMIGEGNELIILNLQTDVPNNNINVGSINSSTEITIIEDDFIEVAFTEDRYTVTEGEAREVCVMIMGGNRVDLPSGGTVDVLVSTTPTAGVEPETDYEPALNPVRGLLNETRNTTCFTFTSLEDILVEGTEDVSVSFSFMNKIGSFVPQGNDETAVVAIVDNDYFEVGFEYSSYTVGEEGERINDTVYIVKMRDNTLLKSYTLTIDVIHSQGPYPAVLDIDFMVDSSPPLMVTFEVNDTRKPVPFTLLDDEFEEGFENFTLQLSDASSDETVRIVEGSAMVHIKDDDVVVIGFERSAYVVFEGQKTEVCVSILDRELSTDDHRNFTIMTNQLKQDPAESHKDFIVILGQTTFIARDPNVTRRCFDLETVDDELLEPPERLNMSGSPISHFIEFNPSSTTIWIVDDDSLLLPVPDVSTLDCVSQTEQQTTLRVTCTPSDDAARVAELVCSVDGEPLRPCSTLSNRRKKRAAEAQVVTLDLLDYQDGVHVLEIVGLTQVTEILRGTVQFHGLVSAKPQAVSVWDDREFVAAIAIAGVALIILMLLMLAICLLIFYHRKVNKLNKYGLDLRSENEYVGIDRNLSYRDHDEHVELVDYSHRPPDIRAPQRGAARPASRASSSAAARSVSRDPSQRERPVSEASTVVIETPTATTFHVPPPPGPTIKPTEAPVLATVTVVQQQRRAPDHVIPDQYSQEDVGDVQTEEELLLASGGLGSGSESRGLKISRRHSVEVEKKPKSRKKVDDETSSFSGSRVRPTDSDGGAYSIPRGKELQSKEWEAELQREFDEETAAKEKETVRARERRREMESRERRITREQVNREMRAEARRERERERDAAKERRLAEEAPRSPTTRGDTSPESPGPESFL